MAPVTIFIEERYPKRNATRTQGGVLLMVSGQFQPAVGNHGKDGPIDEPPVFK